MKLSQFGRKVLAAVAIAAMSLTITACSTGHTVAFLYVATATASPGTIYAYKIDGASGTLTQMPDSPFQSGGRNPVAEVVSPSGLFLYIANRDDSTIVEQAIGTDGKIYPQCTYDIPNATSFPTAMSIDPSGKFLLVAYTYQSGYTNSVPGPGGIDVFSIKPNSATASANSLCTTGPGTLAAVGSFPINGELSPVGINITDNDYVYLTTTGKSIQTPGIAQVIINPVLFAYALNTTTGALTSVTSYTFPIGSQLHALTTDPTGKYLYITDQALNQLYGYSISSGGLLTALVGSPYATGNGPDALAINTVTTPNYLYVANYTDNTISSYSIASGTGVLTALPSGGATNSATATGPNSILIDPVFGFYLYTSNFLSSNVSGKQLNTTTGGLINLQFTPYTSGGEPTALATTSSADAAKSSGLSQVLQ